jgi:RNA polymerase sigma factor (sigma-70 family)
MLTDKEYAGYKTNKLIELKEKDSIDAYESTCKDIKELKGKYKEYVDILLCLCNWLTDNAKYEKSYADWLTTNAGVNLIPRSIVFDNKNDKIVMDVELFQGIVMEGIISEQAKEIKKAMIKEPISLHTPVAEDLCIQDYICDNKHNKPDIITEKKALKKDIEKLLKQLTAREKFILTNRFGLNCDGKIKTLDELGKTLNFSKERIRQIEVEAIKKLRKSENIEEIKEYLRE